MFRFISNSILFYFNLKKIFTLKFTCMQKCLTYNVLMFSKYDLNIVFRNIFNIF